MVLIGLLLAAAGEVVRTTAQRDREAQLLWVGHTYRAAISRYWSTRRTYPQSLHDLLGTEDGSPLQVRYIRQLYRDPMTNEVDWDLVPAPNGGIMGVASHSTRKPIKTGNFETADKAFEDATSYGDWQFTFVPGLGVPPRLNPTP